MPTFRGIRSTRPTMSLKSFHLVFLIASVLLSLFLALFCFDQFEQTRDRSQLMWSVVSGLAALTLVVYGRYFLRKLKHISYL